MASRVRETSPLPPPPPPKRARTSFHADCGLLEVPDHLSLKVLSRTLPPFPGPNRFGRPRWLKALVEKLDFRVREHMREWKLMHLLIFAKHFDDLWINWHAIGGLIEMWHPHTNTFIFPGFEATVLLEEVDLLLGFDKKAPVAHSVESISPGIVLAEFIDDGLQIRSMLNKKGVILNKLGTWLFKAAEDRVDDKKLAKGLSIILAGIFLFPGGDDCLESVHLDNLRSAWLGSSLSQAVLAYLYRGLSSACLGQRFFGSMILLDCWVSMHISLDFGPSSYTHGFSRSPIYLLRSVMRYDDIMVTRTRKLESRYDWRLYLDTFQHADFTACPQVLLGKGFKTHPYQNVDLQLVGNGELVLYNAHRCLVQLGLPRHKIPVSSHLPPIKIRKLGTLEDDVEVRSAIALWQLAPRVEYHLLTVEEKDELRHYLAWVKRLRSKMRA